MRPDPSALPLTQQRLQGLFNSSDGIITPAAALVAGVTSRQLREAFYRGRLKRPYREVYWDPTSPEPTLAEQALAAQLRHSGARPCLFTAQALHGLTTTPKLTLYLAVRRGQKVPADLKTQAIILPVHPDEYDEGIQTLPVGSRALVTYTAATTVVSLLKASSIHGTMAYVEALQMYLLHRLNPHLLIEAASRANLHQSLLEDLKVLLNPGESG